MCVQTGSSKRLHGASVPQRSKILGSLSAPGLGKRFALACQSDHLPPSNIIVCQQQAFAVASLPNDIGIVLKLPASLLPWRFLRIGIHDCA